MSSHSPFLPFSKKSGAVSGDLFAVTLARHYGDVKKELEAARTKAAWFDLSIRRVIEISGADAGDFLERLSSNHLTDLKPDESVLTAFLTPQAKVVATATALRKEADFWLLVQSDLTQKLIDFLTKFVIVDDVTFTERKDLAILGIQGPEADKELARLGIKSNLLPAEGKHTTTNIIQASATILRKSWGNVPGYVLIFSMNDSETFWNGITAKDSLASLAGMDALNILRIENGIPFYGPDMSEEYLLPETGLESAIHYNKGCYTGQEIVARIKSRGQLKRRFARFTIEAKSPPASGAPILLAGVQVGHITSAAFDPTAGLVRALGYAKIEALKPEHNLSVDNYPAHLKN